MERKHPEELLDSLVASYHRTRAELRREGKDGSWRRKFEARLEKMQRDFELTLSRWIEGDELQQQWQQHFYHEKERPPSSPLPTPPLFVGESESGSSVEVKVDDGELLVLVDGSETDRIPAPPVAEFENQPRRALERIFDGQKVVESFEASKPALEALVDFGRGGEGSPPWEYARELYSDGLVDVNFSLTGRGRRYMQNAKVTPGRFATGARE